MLLYFILALSSFLCPHKNYSFEEAVKNGSIRAEIFYFSDTSAGYLDQKASIKIVLKNTDRLVRIALNPGVIFYSDDTAYQDQVLVDRQVVRLMPGEEKEVTLVTMCTQRYRSAPSLNASFHVGEVTSSEMTDLADYLESKKYPYNMAQSAVWCLSDGESIENITGEEERAVNDLRKYVARIRGEEAPLYQISEINRAPSMHTLTLLFKIRLKKDGIGKLVLYDPDGQEYRQLMEEAPMPSGWYEVRFKVESTDLKPGVYHAVLVMNGMNIQHENYRVL